MNGNQDKQSNLVDTTDCLEAVGVFRGWKNFLFIIVALCLLLVQISFWLVNTNYVKVGDNTETGSPVVPVGDTKEIEEAAKQAAKDINQPAEQAAPEPQQQTHGSSLFGITFERLSWLIRLVNAVLILTATLYCLTMLFSLKLSLIGRLGGINHICRAFFLSLIMVILLLPWQKFFGSVIMGAIYTPDELTSWRAADVTSIFETIRYYLRFTGYWLLVVLLLIFSQLRSSRWAKAILRRLEVL